MSLCRNGDGKPVAGPEEELCEDCLVDELVEAVEKFDEPPLPLRLWDPDAN